MPSQRIILGIGLAILLLIGAASIGLDLKSRTDNASLISTLVVLKRLSDLRAAAAPDGKCSARLRADRRTGIRQANTAMPATRIRSGIRRPDGGRQGQSRRARLIEETKALIARQIDVNDELSGFGTPETKPVSPISSRAEDRARRRDRRQSRKGGRRRAQAAFRQRARNPTPTDASSWRSILQASR